MCFSIIKLMQFMPCLKNTVHLHHFACKYSGIFPFAQFSMGTPIKAIIDFKKKKKLKK